MNLPEVSVAVKVLECLIFTMDVDELPHTT